MCLAAPTMKPAPVAPIPQRAAATRVIDFFESLSPQSVHQMGQLYAPGAYFKDPFNEVRGLAPMQGIFTHMFATLERPRFVVIDSIVDGDQCFLTWNFEFYFRRFDTRTLQTVRGASHLKFTADGLVDFHRDYWDAAEELYEKLPVVGALMRWLKRRANN